jgi:RHS repeat-associated protein
MNFSQINIQELQLEHSIEVNPSSGSASVMINIPLSQGRNGFGPGLTMNYSSSSRNSIFGMGWSLGGLTFISIDTNKGLPKYDGSDTFAFDGSISIAPQLVKSGSSWNQRIDETSEYWIYYYRSKNEDAFARFEKWVSKINREVHWRTRSKNNIVSVYGMDSSGATRIFDPENSRKIFIWLLEAQYDNLGNCIQYKYKEENEDNIDPFVSFERNRLRYFREKGFTQKHPERILYGNSLPILPDAPIPNNNRWLFEIAFDYGQYQNRPFASSQPQPGSIWDNRLDLFSVYNPGFEIRTYRLCKRILIYHHFAELSTPTSLTGIFECKYNETESGTTLEGLIYTGVRRDLNSGAYSEKQLPELTFKYSGPVLGKTFKGIAQETYENLPQGFNQGNTQLVDLLGEGIPGILNETANTWYYKPNLGNGLFGKQELILQKPSQNLGIYSLGDFDQDGNLNLFTLQGRMAGFYEYDRDKESWSGYKTFENIPQVSHSKIIDVNADGCPDLVLEREDKIICYPFKGREGFDKPYEFAKPISNGILYAPTIGDNLALDYFLADMTGDGLPDQVRIKNGRVEYYPNLGNGHFGEAVLMESAPVIDFDRTFDASRIRLYDLDGSGTTDILYIGNGEIRYWYNASGNKFVDGGRITGLPYIDNISSAIILDILGQGTPCLVWSNSLNNFHNNSLHYLELTNGVKPRLMTSLENGMGKEIQLKYGHSGKHYLEARRSGRPWISKIPAHFTVVDKKIVIDHITNTRFTTQYKYFDGHYNGNERAFVTFGLVEQYDTEFYDNASITHDRDYAQPTCTKTWLHSGIFGWDTRWTKQYYDKDTEQPLLPRPFFEQDEPLESGDFERGFTSLAGKVLRQEVYATNPEGILEDHPYQISQNGYCIRKLQPKTKWNDSCFFAYQTEALSMIYEQDAADPRVSHHLSVSVDKYGDIEKELNVSYARRSSVPDRLPVQSKDYVTAGVHRFINEDTLHNYQTGILFETKEFEINHVTHNPDEILKLKDVQAIFNGLINNANAFDQQLSTGGLSTARLISWERTYFWNDSFDDVLSLGQTGRLVFAHHEESACFNDNLIAQAFTGKVTPAMLSDSDEGNYVIREGYWWQHTAINHFNSVNGFYNLDRVERETGNITSYKYDAYQLNIIEITDPLGNVTKGEIDYNLVEAYRLIDQNDNVSEVLYDALGVAIVISYQGTVLDASSALQKYGNGLIADYNRRNDESFDNVLSNPALYLQGAATFLFYDFDTWENESEPLRSINLTRGNLVHDGSGNIDNAAILQIELDYQDGFGRIIQSKRKVEPGLAIQRKTDGSINLDVAGELILSKSNNRWLVTGHFVYNNKQQSVRQFEPFFSSTHEFENDTLLETLGVSAQNYYDAAGRVYRMDFPDSTLIDVKFTPWEVQLFDQNDTVDRSLYKISREILPANAVERMALDKSLAHKDTPTTIKLDPLGREIVTIETNNDGTERKIENKYDINGNIAEIKDARNLRAFEYKRDMLGRLLYEKSMDAGEKWSFHNNYDHTIHLWDGRDIHQRPRYDQLGRVTTVHVNGALGLNQITERFLYGEDASVTQAKEKNLKGQLVKHYDQAGTREVKLAIPGGTPVIVERRLLAQFTSEPNWNNPATVALGAHTYISEYTYDALGRPVQQKLPDNTTRKFIFNEGGGVQKVVVTTADGVLNEVELLKNTSYDAKGLRQTTLLGNDVETEYTYNTETFRMKRLRSRRITGTPRTYQDIHYTYDPVGNLIHFVDEAQQPAAASPHVIEGLNASSHSEFEYDALYQLKVASGRVHQALLQNDYTDRSREAGVPPNWGKGTRYIALNNGAAVERYTRTYQYDEAGNIKSIHHNGTSQNWTRQIWTSATSNRSLPLNNLNGIAISNPESRFDENGNCIYMPHLRSIEWNYRNNIAKAVVIDRSSQGKPNDEEYYVYGGDGIRIRRITQRVIDVANDTIELTEKIYLDGCEIKRITHDGTEILKRFASQITDGTNSIAFIHSWEKDTQARETDDVTQKKLHYQLGNHLGSASLELDENGDVITYEEYFPHGGTSFIAGKNKRDIDLKDYRYCEKERDDFTGLYYFGYRYYAHWLGGWISPDPLGPEDSENLYIYVQNNPINLVDPNGLKATEGGVTVTTAAISREQWESFTEEQRDAIRRGDFVTGLGEIITREELNRRISEGQRFDLLAITGITDIRQDPRWQEWRDLGMSEEEADSMVEFFRSIDEASASLSVPPPGDDGGSQAGGATPGETAIGPGGEASDSSGTGRSSDPSNGGANDGTGNGGSQTQTNDGGGGGNTGDGRTGSGTRGRGPGAGQRGAGTGGGGNASGVAGRGTIPGTGTGAGTRPGSGASFRTAGGRGQGQQGNGTRGNGQQGGQVGGSSNGVQGGQIGGSPDGALGGQLGGGPGRSLEGDINGIPDGIRNGTLDGLREGAEGGTGSQSGEGNEPQPGQREGTRQGTPNANGQEGQGQRQQGQGQQGDPRTNWLDTVTRWTGYLNLEFGSNGEGGEAGGIPGGMDLFGWRPPMWVRRTLQVVFIAATVVTTIIPIGKVALAAKVAIQGALKVGLRATARKLIAAVAARLPTRAAIRGALTRVKGTISSALSRLSDLLMNPFLRYFGRKRVGQRTGLARILFRSFWEDRRTFGASRDFFNRWRFIFGQGHGWSLEHMIIKQRWYRGANPVFAHGTFMNRALQGLGDAGWNLVPIPRGLNSWLYRHPAISGIFNYGTYAGIGYGAYEYYDWMDELINGDND